MSRAQVIAELRAEVAYLSTRTLLELEAQQPIALTLDRLAGVSYALWRSELIEPFTL